MLHYEKKAKEKGFEIIVGIDEAGRGPLAGPVVASAVSLKSFDFLSKIDDSKKLSAKQRESAFQEIHSKSYVGVGIIDEKIIDEINILEATFLAMNRAVEELISNLPEDIKRANSFQDKICLLIDGNQFKTTLPYEFVKIVKGDSLSLSIACASIVAKVTRDRIIDSLDEIYPLYGFKKHKGYPTKQHKNAIREYGLSPIHRKTFRH